MLLWLASVAGGVEPVGDGWLVLVVLGDGGTAGGSAEAGIWRCGRARSTSRDSVARRRMALAAVYKAWWCLLLAGRWYGVSAVA